MKTVYGVSQHLNDIKPDVFSLSNEIKNKSVLIGFYSYSYPNNHLDLKELAVQSAQNLFKEKNNFIDSIFIEMEDVDVAFSDSPATMAYYSPMIIPSQRIANKILKFIKKYDGYDVVATCSAGFSRTGAIVSFLESDFGYTVSDINTHFKPNKDLLSFLRKANGTERNN